MTKPICDKLDGQGSQRVYSAYLGGTATARLNPDGSQLLYSTYLGERHNDLAEAVAVGQSGNAYIAGSNRP